MKNLISLFVAVLVLVSASNVASATVACCYTGGECAEAITAQQCSNTGGTPAANNAATCDPNPCGKTQGAPVGISKSITVQDLGVENAGLLPTNPLYFLKDFGRGFRMFFTFNLTNKAKLELDIANQKAAEIKKLEEVAPQNAEAITRATAAYQGNVERLGARLEELQQTSENPNVDKLVNELANRSLQHQQLLDELKDKFKNNAELVEKAGNAQEAILAAVAVVPEKLENITKFGQRLETVVQGQKGEFKELRAAELVDRLEERFTKRTEEKLVKTEEKVEKAAPEDVAQLREELAKIREENARLRNEISNLRSDFLTKFSGRLETRAITGAEAARATPMPAAPAPPSITIQNLSDLPGDPVRRLKLLDELREKASPDVKNQLNIARQGVLRQAEEQKEIISRPPAIPPVTPSLPTTRCDELRKNFEYLNDLLKAGKISEQDYKLKYESLKKELAVCAQNTPVPSAVPAPRPTEKEVFCAQEYNPVCGADGRTYSNECFAKVAGAEVKYKGECEAIRKEEPAVIAPTSMPKPVVAPVPVDSFFDVFVAIDNNGQFSPAAVKIQKGGKVTWVNKSQRDVQPASNVHPLHQLYPGFDALRGIKPGENYSFIFEKTGSWQYHDHLNPLAGGTVDVIE